MVDDTWRQGFQSKVAQTIAAHYHRAALATEGVYNALQRVRVAV